MSLNKISVLMLDGEDELSLLVARCLGDVAGWKLHVLSTLPHAPLRYSRHVTSYHYRSIHCPQERIEAIREILQRTQADVLLPVWKALPFVAVHYPALSALAPITPTPTLELFNIALNKWAMAQFFVQHQIPQPPTVLWTGEEACKQALRAASFPVLLKPVQGTAGRGIEQFDDAPRLMDFLTARPELHGQCIVQDFIPGYDIGCSVLCQDGKILAHTIQTEVLPAERRFAPPAAIKFIDSPMIYEVVSRLMAALGWNGVANIDMRFDARDQRVKVLEVNPRYWGSLLGSLCVGMNFPYYACLAGMGIPFPTPTYRVGYYAGSKKAAVQQAFRRLTGRSEMAFNFKETSWNYAARDPIAAGVAILKGPPAQQLGFQ